jgi:hypothetical protein
VVDRGCFGRVLLHKVGSTYSSLAAMLETWRARGRGGSGKICRHSWSKKGGGRGV